ncbi:mono/diheme cytochrome c family protein [Breoghania corrubedonensis]|uniref:Mono/diheme cytochrome c family protein n=1 Tax=Breoghania corrubedonensis TaxID=665038 RepID=A0A2T5VF56_9HYPH|nr:cytochrome c [Breoghania corrubedonensis]PTW62370.1 mono/diheme cytochrome c family protein [Breoghania corrubedonensis]
MKTLVRIVAVLIVIGLAALAAIIFVPVQRTGPTEKLAADWQAPAGLGKYDARMADCAACHTEPGGKPFAGGRTIASPMGDIYTPNITPDKETGIGTWSLADFRAALVDGVDDEDHHLYPAMPYENYRHMSETDIRAMYDYFMHDVEPVKNQVAETELPFPFNQRWGIRLWNWVTLGNPGFKPASTKVANDEQLSRGAYLVQVLGHCGSCHTPRNLTMAQAGTNETDAKFLTGGEIGGWSAPDLRGPKSAPQQWSADELKMYLTAGRNAHSAVAGEMKLAVEESLQYMSDEDANAMVAYLRAIGTNGPAPAEAPMKRDETPAGTVARIDAADDPTTTKLKKAVDLTDGERLYVDNCGACHFADGRGAPEVFPSLKGNAAVVAKETGGLIHTILYGAEMPSTSKRPMKLRMPGFAQRLSDDDVAKLATFLRGAWGNGAGPVTADQVAKERKTPTEASH